MIIQKDRSIQLERVLARSTRELLKTKRTNDTLLPFWTLRIRMLDLSCQSVHAKQLIHHPLRAATVKGKEKKEIVKRNHLQPVKRTHGRTGGRQSVMDGTRNPSLVFVVTCLSLSLAVFLSVCTDLSLVDTFTLFLSHAGPPLLRQTEADHTQSKERKGTEREGEKLEDELCMTPQHRGNERCI